jgi:ankyrin repeat protein|tara:strand:- start:97 stop:360 length:264 start_codon:yes stop_codon:yes gene_type:complete
MKHLLLTTIAALLLVVCGNSEADSALPKAAKNGNTETVKQHLASGADVNAKDDRGGTPLDVTNDKEIADLLRKHGGKTVEELKAAGN